MGAEPLQGDGRVLRLQHRGVGEHRARAGPRGVAVQPRAAEQVAGAGRHGAGCDPCLCLACAVAQPVAGTAHGLNVCGL